MQSWTQKSFCKKKSLNKNTTNLTISTIYEKMVFKSLNTLACFSLFLASIAESDDGESEAGYDPTKTVYPGNVKLEKKSISLFIFTFFLHIVFIFYNVKPHNVTFAAVFLII